MTKTKLYIYPHAKPHEHDTNSAGMSEHLQNTVPLSEKGIREHCIITSPDAADYFYMGQFAQDTGEILKIGPDSFKHFNGNENRHILDIDGEGGFEASNRPRIPDWLRESIITANGTLKKDQDIENLFTRPTFSHLLIDIVNNKNETFQFPEEKSFGFRGMVNCTTRALMLYTLHNMPDVKKDLKINTHWQGLSDIGSNTQKEFVEHMLRNSLSLCPRGSGIDSVRFLESCYFNRVPIVISDHDYFLFGEDLHDTSFCYRIFKGDMKPSDLHEQLTQIYNTPIEELKRRAKSAKIYFDQVVRRYFEDPTLYFLNWIETKNERK